MAELFTLEGNSDNEFNSLDVYTAASIADIEFLLEYTRCHRGARLNTTNRYGWTALLYACAYGHCMIVNLLLSCGCDERITSPDGVTPLMLSIKSGDNKTFESMLRVSNLEASDHRGWTAIFYAVNYDRELFVKKLVSLGANINCSDHLKHTPLSLAVASGIESITIFLLNHMVYLNGDLPDKQRLYELAHNTNNKHILNIIMDHNNKMRQWNNMLSPNTATVAGAALESPQTSCKSPFTKKRSLLDWRSPCLSYSPAPNKKRQISVEEFLKSIGLEKYYPIFRDEEVDFETMLTLNEEHLKELGIKLLGPRRKIYLAIQRLIGTQRN